MSANDVEVVRQAWAAVRRGDLTAVGSLLAADVRWHGVGDEEGGCHDREEALAFIGGALAEGVTAEALEIRDAGDHVVVVVRTRQPPDRGDQPEPHEEQVRLRHGRISEIVVFPSAGDAGPPVVELLYFDGCPGHERLRPVLERLAAEAGGELRLRAVETLEDAEAERFLGSPTVRVDGVDVEPAAGERDDFGLKCRIYRSEEGQSGAPPEAWIRAALAR